MFTLVRIREEVGITHLLVDQGVEVVRDDTIRRLVRNPTILDNVNNLTQGTKVFAFTVNISWPCRLSTWHAASC